MRISIIGQPGSGKSTLANKISEKFNVPHLHLDKFWFESGGNRLKLGDTEGAEKVRAYMKEKVISFINEHDFWVSDGTYPRVQSIIVEHADYIIFLDIPLYRRLFNHLQRILKTERHKELTRWDDFKFIYQIIRRTFIKGPKMRQFIKEHSNKAKIFRNYKEIDDYLKSLN
jgi:adenylate kinase family enzyme